MGDESSGDEDGEGGDERKSPSSTSGPTSSGPTSSGPTSSGPTSSGPSTPAPASASRSPARSAARARTSAATGDPPPGLDAAALKTLLGALGGAGAAGGGLSELASALGGLGGPGGGDLLSQGLPSQYKLVDDLVGAVGEGVSACGLPALEALALLLAESRQSRVYLRTSGALAKARWQDPCPH